MNRTQLTDAELWLCMDEAEQRKSDKSLTLEARVRSAQTFTLCLREAHNRGYDYGTLKASAIGSAA